MTFEEYVLARGPALVRLARLLVADDHRAEDLVQDALARAYPRWHRICRVPAVVDRAGTDDVSGAAAERDAMWRLVRALPPRQRAVLVLRFYEDLDDAAIADILGCSLVTVRSHAMRALATLRERVGDAGWSVATSVCDQGRTA